MKTSMEDFEADLRYACGWNRYIMMFLGLWPENRKITRISSYIAIFPILMMICFISAPQSIDLMFIWGDFDLVINNLSMGNITITVSTLKTIIFWLHGGSLKSLLTCMANDWKMTVNKHDRKTMLTMAKLTRNLSIYSIILTSTVIVICIFLQIWGQRNTREMFFRAYFPYNATVSPIYELTYTGQVIAAIYSGFTYTVVDNFIIILVLHTCGQLSNLRQELTSLYTTSTTNTVEQTFRKKLGKIVDRHDYINKFAKTIENTFNFLLLIHMLGFTMQLCCHCMRTFETLNSGHMEMFIIHFIFLLFYITLILVQLYMYCYVGERLLVESTDVANAAYNCNWYDFSAHEAKMLTIIMRRARAPLCITAGRFCSFNRELYSEILKSSAAYMSCLYALQTKHAAE